MTLDLIEGASAAAAFTGLSQRKIYRLVEKGCLPTIRKGRRLYFRRSELDRAFQSLPHEMKDAYLPHDSASSPLQCDRGRETVQ